VLLVVGPATLDLSTRHGYDALAAAVVDVLVPRCLAGRFEEVQLILQPRLVTADLIAGLPPGRASMVLG
jgi:hypothetical protein